MTTVELMENLAGFLRKELREYSMAKKSADVFDDESKVEVYAGWPPILTTGTEKSSLVYCLVTEWTDASDGDMSTAKVEIGFSIQDNDKAKGQFTLFNLMEHVRQAMLKKRTVNEKHRLILPVQGVVRDEQPFPQWQGKIIASYTLGQPVEEEFDYGNEY